MKKWTHHSGSKLLHGDCLDHMRSMEPGSVDLVIGSPPYENRRAYGVLKMNKGQGALVGQAWVDWMVTVYEESLRVCKGMVAFVVGHGVTTRYKWSATPALLCASLHHKGINLRAPKIYHRVGIFGSGGPDDLRKDFEWIICATNGGRLPFSNNKAMGRPPKYREGGPPSHRQGNDKRVPITTTCGTKKGKRTTKKIRRKIVDIANPGDVIFCKVGGGHMGSNIAHENEAPYPEDLCDFLIRTWCPPGGIVYDPFGGSGTTLAVAMKRGRVFICSDLRMSQIKLMLRRIKQVESNLGFNIQT